MGHKVFVSYKYHDWQVDNLPGQNYSKVRDYVDVLEQKIGKQNFYKGEQDGEDLSHLKDDTIWNKLKARIYDSTVTIVLISKGMKEPNSYDYSQWIPWEVRYSLCEYGKNERTSHTNGLLYVVLPDVYGSYDYMIEDKSCCDSGCKQYHDNDMFYIMAGNLFNKIYDQSRKCDVGDTIYKADDSYAIMVKWSDFVATDGIMNFYIEMAYQRAQHKEDYVLRTKINKTSSNSGADL